LETVVDHLVEMMAHTHVRAQPLAQREKFLTAHKDEGEGFTDEGYIDGFDPMEHFAGRLKPIWSAYHDLFKSQNVYGASLENLLAVKIMIDQIVMRDRLPTKNSLQAQEQLRDAWNTVDICVYCTNYYKKIAKVSYAAQLLLGVAFIMLTIFRDSLDIELCQQSIDDSSDSGFSDWCGGLYSSTTGVFVTASLLTMVTGVTALYNPAQRWRELRAIAEALQSDMFCFRTRTGSFMMQLSDPRKPELELIGRIQFSRITVVQLGGLTESSFTRKYPAKVYRHGQNANVASISFDPSKLGVDAPIGMENGIKHPDNHHSPMNPDQYISGRLIPMLDYYPSRVPTKHRESKATVMLLLAATSTVTVLSYMSGRRGATADLGAVAGVVAGCAAALTAWQAESGADRKINRYTTAILSIKNHMLWWFSLTSVDKSSLTNINRLVSVGEEIKMGEVNSWADASRQKEQNEPEGESNIPVTQHIVDNDTGTVDNPMFEQE
jgi:hypothetical protein